MKPEKQPESIEAARERLVREITQGQSPEALITFTVELLQLVAAYPPENPVFYRKLKEIQQKLQKPSFDKMLLDMVQDN